MERGSEDGWVRPEAVVDIVLLTLLEAKLHVVLLDRVAEPFKGVPALVGGYVHTEEDKDLDDAVARILKHKAGLRNLFVEQLYSFGSRDRDPRGWSVTVSYLALVPLQDLDASPVRASLRMRPVENAGPLPFDHNDILDKAVERLRGKGAYSVLPAHLLPETFTLMELKSTYEAVMDLPQPLDQSSFRRKMMDLDVVEEVPGDVSRSTDRPARRYRLKGNAGLFSRSI